MARVRKEPLGQRENGEKREKKRETKVDRRKERKRQRDECHQVSSEQPRDGRPADGAH